MYLIEQISTMGEIVIPEIDLGLRIIACIIIRYNVLGLCVDHVYERNEC